MQGLLMVLVATSLVVQQKMTAWDLASVLKMKQLGFAYHCRSATIMQTAKRACVDLKIF